MERPNDAGVRRKLQSAPSHISKMVLSTMHVGGPCKTELRTFRWEVLI